MNISKIHLLQANIGMGLNHQDSLKNSLKSMGSYFLANDPNFFRKHAEVQSYIKYIQKNNPDILYLTEVCGVEQMEEISSALIAMNYNEHIIKGFELWNMDHESHRFLYHIMATKSDFIHKKTIHQFTMNSGIRFMKWKNGLGKSTPSINSQVNSILDGGGSHYQIDGIEMGFMHAHANDSTDVFSGLLNNLYFEGRTSQLLVGDMNMDTNKAKTLVKSTNPDLMLFETIKTYPYYFEAFREGIFESAIRSIMKKKFLSHPDQLYYGSEIQILEHQILGPESTGLKTDHSINQFKFQTSSQG